MRGNGLPGPSSIGLSSRRQPLAESLVGKDLLAALDRRKYRFSSPVPTMAERQVQAVENAARIRAKVLGTAVALGRDDFVGQSIGGRDSDPFFDLDTGFSQFKQALVARDDLDDVDRSREFERLREDAANEALLAGFDAAGERAGLPGMEAFLAGLDEDVSGAPEPDSVSPRAPVQARLRGRLQDRRRQTDAERVRQASAERADRAERAAALRSYLLDGEETPADAREVLDAARASAGLDGSTLDRLDRTLEDRLSFERTRDAALARIDDAIAGGMPGKSDVGAESGIVAADQPWFGESPWLDCHFERWLRARGAKISNVLKTVSYLPPGPGDPSGACRHVLTRWPDHQDIIAYTHAVGAVPPMVANRVAAHWEAGGDAEKAEALSLADAVRTRSGQDVSAPGMQKALSLLGAGASPEQVVAYRKDNPDAFEEHDGQLADRQNTRPAPTGPGASQADAVFDHPSVIQAVAKQPETDETEEPFWVKERRQSAAAELAPGVLPREDLAKRDDETWSHWGRRIYEAFEAAREEGPDATMEISRRYFGDLYKPENADVVRAMDQKVTLEAFLNPPRDQLIDGAELEAFAAWQRENPDATPEEYGLEKSFSAFLGADGNYYRHSVETSKRTGFHTALFHGGIEAFDNYAKVQLGDYKHVVLAGLGGGPSFGRGGLGRATQRSALDPRRVKPFTEPKTPNERTKSGQRPTRDDQESGNTQQNNEDLKLRYMPEWNASQRREADAKCRALCEADTVVTPAKRPKVSVKRLFMKSGRSVPKGKDVDHIKDLQLGGTTTLDNLDLLDASVNRSLGAQIHHQIKNLPPGTVINKVTIE